VIVVHMIGNAHIDPVWLWNWQSGADEALATFRSAADRCDEYPEFIFTRGEAWPYRQVERQDPALFERIRDLVQRGQWHITGGQHVQPDANLPTESGWRRQLAHGRRYFQERFGVTPNVAYNVDSFGHPASLPDILASAGYIGYVFHRPKLDQMGLPAQAFRWLGAGRAEVLGCRITPGYVTNTDDLYGQIVLALEAATERVGHALCFYGVGNHGGGPTKANIEYILEHAGDFDGAELRFSTPQAFFEAVSARREILPVVEDELQHTFPGCYSAMHDVKQRQFRNEHLLAQCERALEAFVDDAEAREGFRQRLDEAWDDLLFTQFHDILAGTSIPSAYESVQALQGRARAAGEEILYETTRRWARRALPSHDEHEIVVVNSDGAPWEGHVATEPWLDFDPWGRRWLADCEGNAIDFQQVQPESHLHTSRIVFPLRVPAESSERVIVRRDPPPADARVATDLEVGGNTFSNAHVSVALNDCGIGGFRLRDEELLGPEGISLHLRDDHTDTWTYYTDRFEEPVVERLGREAWVVEERGPLRARVRLEGWLGRSWIQWTLTLQRDDPRLFMHLAVTFTERFKLLQMAMQLGSAPTRWLCGLPGGHVERRPGATEWPVQGWSCVELEATKLALVTGDAYSLSLCDDLWQWTLLRSPKMAWGGGEPDVYSGRDRHTDQGWHEFDLILRPGTTLDPSLLHTAARQQAQPPVVFDRYEGVPRPPWGNSPPRQLWFEAVHRALQDGRLPHLRAQAETGTRPYVERRRDAGQRSLER
jgi:alpha-mannosidase